MTEAVALVVVAVVALCLLPWLEALRMTAALAVAYLVPRAAYSRMTHATLAGHIVLMLAALWLMGIAIPFVHHCTVRCGASFQMPLLFNDAANYYEWALAHYDGSAVEPKVTFWGYSLLIIGLWKVLGVNIIWPVAANVMATLLTIVITGALAARITQSHLSRVATLAMAMIAVQGFFMSQGAQMLKEPWGYLAITLIGYGMMPSPFPVPLRTWQVASIHEGRVQCGGKSKLPPLQGGQRGATYVLIYAMGCFILAAVRAKYVNFMFIGIAMMLVAGGRKQWRHHATLLTITIVCWWLGMAMTDHYTVTQQVNNVTGEGGMAGLFAPDGVYQSLLGDYFHYPVWKKILYLPLTCGVQWIIPFPWLPHGETISWLNIAPRLRLGWYLLSGGVIYFYIFCSWRRGWLWMVWSWFPMVCFAGIAYMTSGTVSRYMLAFQPWWMAMVAVPVSRLMSGLPGNKRLVWFTVAYVALMAIILAACYIAIGSS